MKHRAPIKAPPTQAQPVEMGVILRNRDDAVEVWAHAGPDVVVMKPPLIMPGPHQKYLVRREIEEATRLGWFVRDETDGRWMHNSERTPSMTKRRYELDRIDAEGFAEALHLAGFDGQYPHAEFARLFDLHPNKVSQWLKGEDIPHWVPVVLTLMQRPGSFELVRRICNEMIRFDSHHPELGEYPYRGGRQSTGSAA